MGKWVDVLVGSGSGLESAEIRVHYTAQERGDLDEGSLRLYWWNGSKWTLCSDSGVDKSSGFVWAKLDGDGQPGPADLQGTLFAVGTVWRWDDVLVADTGGHPDRGGPVDSLPALLGAGGEERAEGGGRIPVPGVLVLMVLALVAPAAVPQNAGAA